MTASPRGLLEGGVWSSGRLEEERTGGPNLTRSPPHLGDGQLQQLADPYGCMLDSSLALLGRDVSSKVVITCRTMQEANGGPSDIGRPRTTTMNSLCNRQRYPHSAHRGSFSTTGTKHIYLQEKRPNVSASHPPSSCHSHLAKVLAVSRLLSEP
jgi:hypothetical protein